MAKRSYEVAMDPQLRPLHPFPAPMTDHAAAERMLVFNAEAMGIDPAAAEAALKELAHRDFAGHYFFYPDTVEGRPFPKSRRNFDIVVKIRVTSDEEKNRRKAFQEARRIAQLLQARGEWGRDGVWKDVFTTENTEDTER